MKSSHLQVLGRLARIWIGAALLHSASMADAGASTVKTLDFRQMAQSADVIAEATVQSVTPYWFSPGGSRAIRTRVTFAVSRVIKGTVGSTLSLDFLGGRVGAANLKVEGMPKFVPAEHYILFSAAPDQALVCPILGFDQGAMRVVHDNQDSLDRVFRYWGQPVSETENFRSRLPATPETTSGQYLRTADTKERFLQRVQQALTQ
jgi:hypothetical protein